MYNYKIIEYPNGTTQIRCYTIPLEKYDKSIENWYNALWNPWDDECNEHKEQKEIYTDFDAIRFIEELPDDFIDSLIKDAPTDEEKERYKALKDNWNANRAKQKLYEYSRCYPWDYFVTFTMDGTKVDRYDYEECSKKLRKWLNNSKRTCPDLRYVVVPEQHKDGAWHFHGLIANADGLRMTDSGHKVDKEPIYNIEAYNLGFTTATKVKDINRVSKYIGKYITKSLLECTRGKQRYYVSQNLPKPKEYKVYYDPDEKTMYDVVNDYCEKNNKEVKYISSSECEFFGVDYIELD